MIRVNNDRLYRFLDERHLYVEQVRSKKFEDTRVNGSKPIRVFRGSFQLYAQYYLVLYENGALKRFFTTKKPKVIEYLKEKGVWDEPVWYVDDGIIAGQKSRGLQLDSDKINALLGIM